MWWSTTYIQSSAWYKIDQNGDVSTRDQLLEVPDDDLQQNQSRMLGDMIPTRMLKLIIPHEEEATPDVKIRFPVEDISHDHHKSRSWPFGLNRDIVNQVLPMQPRRTGIEGPQWSAKDINDQHSAANKVFFSWLVVAWQICKPLSYVKGVLKISWDLRGLWGAVGRDPKKGGVFN